jgi:DNA-binding MarR family transcriptional regulator
VGTFSGGVGHEGSDVSTLVIVSDIKPNLRTEVVNCVQILFFPGVKTIVGYRAKPGNKFITIRDESGELSVLSCLKTVGISRLSDWDVLAFIYRHGVSLASADQIARLTGYENTVVSGALDRLEAGKLIQRSRVSQGICVYRVPGPANAEHSHCLENLLRLSRSREGRLMMKKQLKPVPTELRREEHSPEIHRTEGINYA